MFLVDIIIASISSIFFAWIYSQIICSLFFGIPDVVFLKKNKILNNNARILTYFLTILFYSVLCYVLYILFKNNLSEEWFGAVQIGMLVALFYSFGIFSDKRKTLLYQDLMSDQRECYGDIINDLYNLSCDFSNKILDEIDKNVFNYPVDKIISANITMMYCYFMGINYYIKTGYIKNEKMKNYFIAGLLIKLSDTTHTSYSILENILKEIMINNRKYINMEINEKMRLEFSVDYLTMMVPHKDFINFDSDDLYNKLIYISVMFFGIILGNDIDYPDDKGIALCMSNDSIKGILSTNKNDEIMKEKIMDKEEIDTDLDYEYDEDLEDFDDNVDNEEIYDEVLDEEDIDENDDFFKEEEFEFSYAKVKEGLKKLGYNNYATFKKEVYNSKKIKRKKFEDKEKEVDYLVKTLGYDDFEDFYYTNIEDE